MDPLFRKLGKCKVQFTGSDPKSSQIPPSHKNLRFGVCMDRLQEGTSNGHRNPLGSAGKPDFNP